MVCHLVRLQAFLLACLFVAGSATVHADQIRPAFVATSQEVTGGILGTNPLLTDGLNALLASNLENFPFLLEVADLVDCSQQRATVRVDSSHSPSRPLLHSLLGRRR